MGQSINDVGDFRFTTDKNEFLRLIIEDANLGRTFVPFIGSGLSSPSGIIMGMEFTNYLAFTMYLVLCDPKKRKPTHGEGISERWNLILQGWPPLPSRPEVSTAKTWIKKEFDGLCKEFKLRSSYDDKQQIQMLVPESGTQINDVAIALTQPPIPMILRSWHAKAEQDRLRQLRGILKTDGGKDKQFTSPHWKRSNQSFHDVIVESGLRALSDWRETLEFLSRVVIDEHGLRMGDPNPSIIDDFNSTITRDKRPNLGHKMLAHLSEPLRISTLLTTNFDTLMEEAYRSLSLPLTVLPVSAKGELPNQRTAGSCDSLIKLHGESHDTRADLSLDDEPSAEDKATFLAYMQRGTGHLLPRKPVNPLPDRTSRLLVVGYSGSDHRCVQMIKHWLEHSTDQPRAYWICFSESDQKRIEELFASSSFDGQIKTVLTARPDLLLYELYQKLQFCLPPGGLTYEFTHILPPERIRNFDHRQDQVSEILQEASKTQASYTLVARHNKRLIRDAIVQDVCNEMLYSVNNKEVGQKESHFINKAPWYPLYKLDVKKLGVEPKDQSNKIRELKKISYAHHPTLIDCAGGIVRASALAANKLSQEHSRKVFWIELQDYLDTDSLLRDFLRSLALRCGYFQSMHVTMHPFSDGFKFDSQEEKTNPSLSTSQQPNANDKKIKDLAQHIRLVLDEYRIDPSSVVIFLSGRDSYGVAAGVINTAWKETEFGNLHMLIDVFATVGIPTVYLPCTKDRSNRRIEQIQSHRSDENQEPTINWPDDPIATKILATSGSNKEAFRLTKDVSVFQDIINSTLSEFYRITKLGAGDYKYELKTKVDLRKLEFIYSLTLFRHSRHANALASEGAFSCPYKYQSYGIDNDFVRSIQVNRWIEKLSDERLFFMKPGGAFWMHRDIRQAIQAILENTSFENYNPENTDRLNRRLIESRARKHFWIGEWYHKAFCSSGHITPVIESVYHLLNSAIYAFEASPKENFSVPDRQEMSKESLRAYRAMMIESAIMQASKCLLLSWEYLEMWQSSIASVAWLDTHHRKQIVDDLTSAISNCKLMRGEKSRINKTITHFVKIHEALGQAVVNEGGRSARILKSGSSRESLILKSVENQTNENQTNTEEIEFKQGVDEFRMPNVEDFIQNLIDKLGNHGEQGSQKALRSKADQDLFRNMRDAANDSKYFKKFGEEKAKWKLNAFTEDKHRFIWFLGEAAYLLLRRAKLHYHAKGVVDKSNWVLSTVCCNLGIDLCKHLPPWELDYEVSAKAKMHRIYAIGLANLGRFHEANRHLCEAQGLVSKWSHGTSVEHAMISIRRAEVKLTECHWIALLLKTSIDPKSDKLEDPDNTIRFEKENVILVRSKASKDTQVHELRFLIPSTSEGAKRCWGLGELKGLEGQAELSTGLDPQTQIMPPRMFEALRVHRPIDYIFGQEKKDLDIQKTWLCNFQVTLKNMYLSILDEAVRALDIAEINLSGKSQSSLWWSRIRTLRLRTYGMLNVLPEDARYCIIFRKQSADTGIFKNFLAARRIAGEDELRQLRALKYFLEAYHWYYGYRNTGTERGLEYSAFLPESYEAARELANSLWSNNKGKQPGDLLQMAIFNCINSNEEMRRLVDGFPSSL
jgi:hypothetical protein